MAISLRRFKALITEHVIEILWKQWASLGIATNMCEEKAIIIDLEALLITTFFFKRVDKRLFSSSVEWLLRSGKWVNISRLKRMEKTFNFNRKIVDEFSPADVIAGLLKNAKSGNIPEEYKFYVGDFRERGVVSDPVIKKPVLLQLMLRGLLGINARVETIMFLLTGKSGSSLGIAKEIFYDQKIVYRILESWRRIGLIERAEGKNYYMKRLKEWMELLDIKKIPMYINWGRFFSVLLKISDSLSLKPWIENKYMVSSLFRDVYEELRPVAESLNEKLPHPELYKGEDYFNPFAESLIKICEKIKGD